MNDVIYFVGNKLLTFKTSRIVNSSNPYQFADFIFAFDKNLHMFYTLKNRFGSQMHFYSIQCVLRYLSENVGFSVSGAIEVVDLTDTKDQKEIIRQIEARLVNEKDSVSSVSTQVL